mgnify:FL=1
MANMFDYLKWRGDLKLWQVGFCDVDALIMTELTYVNHDGIVPSAPDDGLVTISDEVRRYNVLHRGEKLSLGAIVPAEIIDLFFAVGAVGRFADVGLCCYENIVDDNAVEQFSAITAKLTDGTLFVGYRGTDDSIAGWKENFQMSFKSPVAAQYRAADYLNRIADHFGAYPIRVGGHSKGGNLAMWAAANCRSDVAERILDVYNMDGPGFLKNYHESSGYLAIKDRIKTIVPEKSVVGMFLEHEGNYRTVKSTERGLMQHNALSWQIMGAAFEFADDLSPDAKRADDILSAWIAGMDDEFREKFTDAFFGILYSTKSTTLSDLMSDKPALLRAFSSADAETRQALSEGFRRLLGESGKNISDWLKSHRTSAET